MTAPIVDVERLSGALRRALGPVDESTMLLYRNRGYNPALVDSVAALAAWIYAHPDGRGATRHMPIHGLADDSRNRAEVFIRLTSVWQVLAYPSVPEASLDVLSHDVALAWLAVWVGAPAGDGFVATDDLLGPRTDADRALVRRWLALGAAGALAWAAGLTLEEAEQQDAQGILASAADGLRALAALRNWRLPAPA